jgi:DNA-directed RNA polymerase subunit RPC12/RpoP
MDTYKCDNCGEEEKDVEEGGIGYPCEECSGYMAYLTTQKDKAEVACNDGLNDLAIDMYNVLYKILELPHVQSELAYLDKGIGTSTENKIWLEARKIVKETGI